MKRGLKWCEERAEKNGSRGQGKVQGKGGERNRNRNQGKNIKKKGLGIYEKDTILDTWIVRGRLCGEVVLFSPLVVLGDRGVVFN